MTEVKIEPISEETYNRNRGLINESTERKKCLTGDAPEEVYRTVVSYEACPHCDEKIKVKVIMRLRGKE